MGAEEGAVHGADRQEGDFIVKRDERFEDDTASLGPSGGHGVLPCFQKIRFGADDRLSLPRRRHNRLHHAGVSDGAGRLFQLLGPVDEPKLTRRKFQFLRRQPPDPLPVHRQPRGAGGRDDGKMFFRLDQIIGGDRFDLRNDQIGPLR